MRKKKIQQTVLDPNGEFNGKLTFEALRAMKKLEFAVRETVRLFFFFLFSFKDIMEGITTVALALKNAAIVKVVADVQKVKNTNK